MNKKQKITSFIKKYFYFLLILYFSLYFLYFRVKYRVELEMLFIHYESFNPTTNHIYA